MQDVIDIQVTPLSRACGAEISRVDLTRPLSAETVRAIRDAWNKYIILVFRGQKVSQDDQLRFASYFGELGERNRAKTALAKKVEGTQPTHKNVMLVTNIKEDHVLQHVRGL
jgi:taurine dioxygenase